jgi:biopolymer transport protein ExbD
MRFTRKKPQRGDFGVVVTSLLDINFLLIMFFLMTAQFQRETHATLDLPREKGEQKAHPDEAGLVINIAKNGDIIITNKTIPLDQLRLLVQEQLDQKSRQDSGDQSHEPLKLMIRADREANTEHLNRVVTLLREMGVGTMRVATQEPGR